MVEALLVDIEDGSVGPEDADDDVADIFFECLRLINCFG